MRKNPFRSIWDHPIYNNAYEFEVPKYPMLIDVELTNNCNMSCLFCDRQIMKRERGFMDEALYKKIVDDIANNSPFVKAIKFSRWGEPSLHPKFYEFLHMAKGKDLIIHVTSNGLLLDPKRCGTIDSLNISMQGLTEEEYSKMRNTKRYKDLVAVIMGILSEEVRPFVTLSATVLDESKEEIEKFKEKWSRHVDRVNIGQTSFVRVDNKEMIERQSWSGRTSPCNDIRTRLSIDWDGHVTLCCADFDRYLCIGTIKEHSIEELWNGDRACSIREKFLTEEWKEIPFCKDCSHRW